MSVVPPAGPWSLESMLASVVAGVIANATTSVLHAAGSGQVIGDRAFSSEAFRRKLLPYLQKGAAAAAKRLTSTNARTSNAIKHFFSSPEAENVARQLFSTQLVRVKDAEVLARIRLEFDTFARSYAGSLSDAACAELFALLVSGCEHALTEAIDDGVLAAHEAMSAARFHVINTELRAIRSMVNATRTNEVQQRQAQVFEEKYRHQVAEKHRWIVLPHLHTMNRVESVRLFVPPSVRSVAAASAVPLEQFWAALSRAVVIGNPGAGKSTLLEYTCMKVASQYDDRFVAKRLLTPVLVTVSEYAQAYRQERMTISQFIEKRAASRYQLRVPEGAVEYLLASGRAMVLFDGLDEVIDVARRAEICGAIESFCQAYGSVPVIVTSREVGYDYAPLRHDLFHVFRIEPFDEPRISDYARKWFTVAPHRDETEVETFARGLVRETATAAPDLRTNPLMLGLICNLYSSEGYIPEHRAEVYEKCAMLLYEQWDRRRDLPTLAFETQLKPIVAAVAYRMYTEPPLGGGVPEEDLISRVSDLLLPKYRDAARARRAAKEFVSFCKGRAWIFTDVGADTQTSLYQFTHRTFLEYFTAVHIVGTNETVGELLETVLPHIAAGEWELVARMAFQIKARQTFSATEPLLERTLARAETAKLPAAHRLIHFTAGALEALVPSVDTVRLIAGQLVTACVAAHMSGPAAGAPMPNAAETLLAANMSSRLQLVDEVMHALNHNLEGTQRISAAAIEVICDWCGYLLSQIAAGSITRDGFVLFRGLREIVTKHAVRCETIWRNSHPALLRAFMAHCAHAGHLIRGGGVQSLFERIEHPRGDIDTLLLFELFSSSARDRGDTWLVDSFGAIGTAAASGTPPYVIAPKLPEEDDPPWVAGPGRAVTMDAPPMAKFGAFVSVAILFEWWAEILRLPLPASIVKDLAPLMLARVKRRWDRRREEVVRNWCIGEAELALTRRWVNREVSFVRRLDVTQLRSGGGR